jgi:hypothetical protein
MLRMIFEKSMETDANTAQPPTPPPAREMARRGEALRLGLPLAETLKHLPKTDYIH